MSKVNHAIADAVFDYLADPDRRQLLDELRASESIKRANERMHRLTGVRAFFPDRQALADFQQALSLSSSNQERHREREWGDFQTPLPLASRICRYLAEIGLAPRVMIEPTYGAGSFVLAALESFPSVELVYGVEIQTKYQWQLKTALLAQALKGRRVSAEIELHQDDIFAHLFPVDILRAGDILIIGNPPWVTSSELGALDAHNLPQKSNLKRLNGLDALTGKSNFDIGEFILLRMLKLFSGQSGAIAMLCKNSVIKNIIEALPQFHFQLTNIQAYSIDAKQEFGAAVDASLLFLKMGQSVAEFQCKMASLDRPDEVTRVFGWTKDRFVYDVQRYQQASAIEGRSPWTWRQGIKHDCAKILELNESDAVLTNGNGEIVDIEEAWIYWLLKGSDLKSFQVERARKKVIVTQRHTSDDTLGIRESAPRLWRYLDKNKGYFEKRKSSIYRDRPPFSIFGIGEYSFKPYKVAISGLHKQPRFSLVAPVEQRPVMLDDTCYFLGFESYLDGLLTASILNSGLVQEFLRSIVFIDAKRPYTKEILMRIDLRQAARQLTLSTLRRFWADIGYEPQQSVSTSDFEAYRERLSNDDRRQESIQLKLNV